MRKIIGTKKTLNHRTASPGQISKGALIRIACLFIAVFLSGCYLTGHRVDTWKKIDASERNALRYGTIAVGATRVANYNTPALEGSRAWLTNSIDSMREDLKTAPSPEAVSRYIKYGATSFWLNILPAKIIASLVGSAPSFANVTDSSGENLEHKLMDFQKDILNGVVSGIEPNRIDMMTLRLSALRFLESKREDMTLADTYPLDTKHYRRVQISVALTAWTRKPAAAALVYMDLYPFNADHWCHEVAQIVNTTSAECKYNDNKHMGEPTGAPDNPFGNVCEALDNLSKTYNITNNEKKTRNTEIREWLASGDEEDRVAACHRWLMNNHLAPKLVHVESLGDSRYALHEEAQQVAREVGFKMGFSDIGVGTGHKGGEMSADKRAEIKVTALSFAAGDSRAGWFFMSEDSDKIMRPIEHRVRLVVDVPKDLLKMDINVHKLFLNSDGKILNDFSEQTHALHSTRKILDDIEKAPTRCEGVPKNEECYPGNTYWQLAKSRVRNLLSLGWHERIVVDMPPDK